jgi:type IV secretory pathway TrbD component
MNHPEGFEVPLHRSLVEPMLLAGLPRIVLHAVAAAATQADPHVFEIVIVAVRTPKRLEP